MTLKNGGAWTTLGKDKLASSGLNTQIASMHGMYEIASAMQLDESFQALPALVLPYHDIEGQPARSHPRWPDFYRIRYLAKGNTFKDLATDKSQRYAQPPNTGVCAYFAKGQNWKTIANDPKQGLIITEGEFKAVAACEVGYPTIGLGGVWNFMSSRDGIFFLPELEKFKWVRRDVWICFDSDYASNPNVCAAINRLGQELEERGACVYVLLLPELVEGGKTGLDDYFLECTTEQFETLLEDAPPIGFSKSLWRLNSEVIYVEDPGLVVVEATGQKMAASHFKEHSRWATSNYPARSINKEGEIVTKKESAAPAWIKWPLRRSAHRITYAPGQARITEANEYNQWPGWGCQPKKGDASLFIRLVDFLFRDADKGAKEWFLDWLAYPLQNPGSKMFSSAVIWGRLQGTGKTLVGYTMGKIYGKNFKEITDEDIESTYTSWAENKQFIMGDEISGNDNRQSANTLKRLITQRSMTINIKFVPQYESPDCINYYWTSNHCDAFFLEDTDRRYFIHEVSDDLMEKSFYDAYDQALWRGDLASAVFQWLLDRQFKVNPSTKQVFSPTAPAFRTSAKDRMVYTGKGELAAWVHDLRENADQILMVGQMRHTRDLFTSKELVLMFNQHSDSKITSVGMGRALTAAGFPQMDNGNPLKGGDGKQGRYFAVRNVSTWRRNKDRRAMERNIAMPPVRCSK